MKIIAGTLGGRRFNAPRGHRTHPMSDKVRGALFNSLGDITGLTILDAFAGSGALGLEALSRGALRSTLIDSDKKAYLVIKENTATLGLNDRSKITNANVSSWSDNNPDQTFSIVLVDPPFDRLQARTIQKLTRHLEKDGLFVVNWPGKQEPIELDGMKLVEQKKYGDTQLLFYRCAS